MSHHLTTPGHTPHTQPKPKTSHLHRPRRRTSRQQEPQALDPIYQMDPFYGTIMTQGANFPKWIQNGSKQKRHVPGLLLACHLHQSPFRIVLFPSLASHSVFDEIFCVGFSIGFRIEAPHGLSLALSNSLQTTLASYSIISATSKHTSASLRKLLRLTLCNLLPFVFL